MTLAKNSLIGLLLFILLLLYTPIIQKTAQPLTIKDSILKVDAIVVLSGGWQKEGVLGVATMERYEYGLKLFQEGWAPVIIFSGGSLTKPITEADEMAEMALSQGFPYASIIPENSSESTYENVLFTKKILKERKLNSIILVTSPYHTLRAKKMFEDKDVLVIAAPVPGGHFEKANGLERLKLGKTIISEYAKLVFYYSFER